MMRGLVVSLVVALAFVAAHAQGPPAQANPKPPWQRLLQGEDAKKAAELAKKIAEHEKADRYPDAIAAAEELLALRRRVQGDDHWEAVDQRWSLEALRKVAALPAGARGDWRVAREKAAGADGLEKQGKYREAEPLLRDWLTKCQEVLGEVHPDTSAGYNDLARNLKAQGRYTEAGPLLQKALDISRAALSETHPDTAVCYNNLASNLGAQGRYAEAGPLYRTALDIWRAAHGEAHPHTAVSYNNLAFNLADQGRYAEAGPLYRTALDIWRAALGEAHSYTAAGYNNFARNLNAQGRYAEAGPLYRTALDIHRAALGEAHPDTATSYNNLAHNLNAQGRYAEAGPLHQKALDVRRAALGEAHPDTAMSYTNLARNLADQGRYAEAGPLFQKAMDIYRAALGEAHPDKALGYTNLAHNLNAQGRYAEAGPLHQKALDIYRAALGEAHPDTAMSYNNLAFNLNARGRYAEALLSLETAVRGYEAARLGVAARGTDRAAFGAARSPYRHLAAVQARAGQFRQAWEALEADLARGLLDDAVSRRGDGLGPGERQQRTALTTRLADLQPRTLRLVTAKEPTDAGRQELEALLGERARLDEQLAALAATVSRREVADLTAILAVLPADAALIAWVDVADRSGGVQEHWGCALRPGGPPAWERLPGTGPDGRWTKEDDGMPEQFRAALAGAAPAAEVAVLAQRLAAQRLFPLEKHLAGVRRLLVVPVNEMAGVPVEVLTDKYTISYIPSGTNLVKLNAKPRPAGEATVLALGDPVFAAIGRPAPADRPLPPGGLLTTQVVPGGAAANARLQAGDVLLAYAGTDLTSTEQLNKLIADHAADKSVPVRVWREGEKDTAVRDLPPGKLGVVLAPQPAPVTLAERRKTDRMLASLRGGDWTELPGTRVELARLTKAFGPRATVLSDSDASEQRLEELRAAGKLKGFRYLHLATHGETNDAKAFESALILAQDHLPADPTAGVVARDAKAQFIDGRLTANEVLAGWDLDAELVTLSACESGLGRKGGGDGLLGFAQAFLLAGSRSVCLTLWKVDDTATALLMDRFYQNLLGRRTGLDKPLPKAEALTEAKRWLRELTADEAAKLTAELTGGVARGKDQPALKLVPPAADPATAGQPRPFAHPRYWAAFVLIGDPN